MNLAYIALGSNLENPLQQVTAATTAIAGLGNIVRLSAWYRSRAVGPAELPEYSQPDYINGVLALTTALSPEELLDALQSIEQAQGRIRTIRWGARTLDLDILLFNQATLQTPRLSIPHPHMTLRNFVVVPLHEIAPDLILPDGRTIADILATLHTEGLEKLGQNR